MVGGHGCYSAPLLERGGGVACLVAALLSMTCICLFAENVSGDFGGVDRPVVQVSCPLSGSSCRVLYDRRRGLEGLWWRLGAFAASRALIAEVGCCSGFKVFIRKIRRRFCTPSLPPLLLTDQNSTPHGMALDAEPAFFCVVAQPLFGPSAVCRGQTRVRGRGNVQSTLACEARVRLAHRAPRASQARKRHAATHVQLCYLL